MMENINQILLNNAGQKLTTELLNGMSHAIRVVLETSSPSASQSPDVLSSAEGEELPLSDENISERGKTHVV